MAEVASGDAVVRVAEKGKFDGEIVVGVLGELLTRVVIDNVKKLSDSHSEWWEQLRGCDRGRGANGGEKHCMNE